MSSNSNPCGFVGIHIGAGYHDPSREKEYKELIIAACMLAQQALAKYKENGALRAVEEAISFLEDSPLTNAGKGSCLSIDGHVECDSSIMESFQNGKNNYSTTFGAIGAGLQIKDIGNNNVVPRIKNPIRLATKLLISQKKNNHKLLLGRVCPMMLVGEAALDWLVNYSDSDLPSHSTTEEELFVRSTKNLLVEEKELITLQSQEQWNQFSSRLQKAQERKSHDSLSKKRKYSLSTTSSNSQQDPQLSTHTENVHDTVGAIAIDHGVSSGGIPLKYRGRIGEAAMYACGCWSSACSIPTESAENSRNKECILTACSATGTGEHLISSMIAKEVCTELSRSSSEPKEIVERFMKSSFLNSNTQRFGGFIALRVHPEEKCLDFVWSHSTDSMGVGFMSSGEKSPQVFISRLPENKEVGKEALTNSFCTSFVIK